VGEPFLAWAAADRAMFAAGQSATRYTLRALLDKLDELLGANPGRTSGQG